MYQIYHSISLKPFVLFLFLSITIPAFSQTKNTGMQKHNREQDENIRIQGAIKEPFSVSGGKVTGYMYEVRIMILTDKKITIDSLFVGDKFVSKDISRYTMKDSHEKTALRKNETVKIAGSLKDQVLKIYEKCPYKYDGAMLVAYTVGGKHKTFAIQNVKAQKGDKDNIKD
jgi:hypothetical protein